MTFRLFNKLNEVFQSGKEVVLRDYDDDGYHTVDTFSEWSEINEIDDAMENIQMQIYLYLMVILMKSWRFEYEFFRFR